MVHQEQHHFGEPSRNGYHNREWANMMGCRWPAAERHWRARGKRTGQKVSHYIVEGGPFDLAFQAHPFVLPYYDRLRDPEAAQRKLKFTYICSNDAEHRLTGKPGLEPHCGLCDMAPMIARAPGASA